MAADERGSKQIMKLALINGIPFGTWHLRFVEWIAELGLITPTLKTAH
jgi:hypothetical protein